MRLAWLSKHSRRDVARSVDRMVLASDGVPGDYVFMHDGAHWQDDAAKSVFHPMFTTATNEAAAAIMVAQFTSSNMPALINGVPSANDGVFQRSEGMT